MLESATERRNHMAANEIALTARINELEKQVSELKGQLAQSNQAIGQNNQAILHSNRLTIWQFISFTLVMAGTLIGTLAWISSSLREENRMIQRQIEQTRTELQRQIEQSERNINARFEDLRQIVLSQQKKATQQ